jgi:carbamoyl-phosphate synthase small subunit
MMMIASSDIFDIPTLDSMLKSAKRIEEINYIEEISTKSPYIHKSSKWSDDNFSYMTQSNPQKKIIAIDFGAKRNILNELVAVGFDVEVMPHTFDANEIISKYNNKEIGGVFLSNGPGDPLILKKERLQIEKLISSKMPMFGICLGHQLLSIAHGYETYKLKFGHHGGNHPVKNIKTGGVEITSQNHNYNIPDSILDIADITHINLFDNTIEGIKYKDSNIFSVQFHPEASPGPRESKYLFQDFFDIIA